MTAETDNNFASRAGFCVLFARVSCLLLSLLPCGGSRPEFRLGAESGLNIILANDPMHGNPAVNHFLRRPCPLPMYGEPPLNRVAYRLQISNQYFRETLIY